MWLKTATLAGYHNLKEIMQFKRQEDFLFVLTEYAALAPVSQCLQSGLIVL